MSQRNQMFLNLANNYSHIADIIRGGHSVL